MRNEYETLKWKKFILQKIYNLNYNNKNYINEIYSILQLWEINILTLL